MLTAVAVDATDAGRVSCALVCADDVGRANGRDVLGIDSTFDDCAIFEVFCALDRPGT